MKNSIIGVMGIIILALTTYNFILTKEYNVYKEYYVQTNKFLMYIDDNICISDVYDCDEFYIALDKANKIYNRR